MVEQVRLERLTQAVAPMTKGPFLQTPRIGRWNFNPSNTETIDEVGVFHPTATYTGVWGRLTVTNGSLRAFDRSWVKVAAPSQPTSRPLSGPGWTLELEPGWVLCEREPSGSFAVAVASECSSAAGPSGVEKR